MLSSGSYKFLKMKGFFPRKGYLEKPKEMNKETFLFFLSKIRK